VSQRYLPAIDYSGATRTVAVAEPFVTGPDHPRLGVPTLAGIGDDQRPDFWPITALRIVGPSVRLHREALRLAGIIIAAREGGPSAVAAEVASTPNPLDVLRALGYTDAELAAAIAESQS
jgi:hypothetical protein